MPLFTEEKTGLLIIDSHAMVYRAYYAMQKQNLTNPVTGQPTGAIAGFFRMVFKALIAYAPKQVVFTWDSPGKTFRTSMWAAYKATRKPMPDDLRPQIDEIKELTRECRFVNLEMPGFEADDIMGSLVKRFERKEQILLLTGDKDCYQLLSNNVRMIRGKKGVSDFIIIDPEWVLKELGISCDRVIDYMGLVGDSSDNFPGVKGIGPKTAATLIQEYKTLDNLYEHIETLKPESLRAKLLKSKENAFLSRKLATIDVEMEDVHNLTETELLIPDFLTERTLMMFRNAGYNQIYNDLSRFRDKERKAKKNVGNNNPDRERIHLLNDNSNRKYILIQSMDELEKTVNALCDNDLLSVDTETDSRQPMLANLAGISLSTTKEKAYYIPLLPVDSPYHEDGLKLENARPLLNELLGRKSIKKIGQNIKYDYIVLKRHGIKLENIFFDTMIASYLCNPNVRRHNLDDMALDLIGYETIKYEDVVGSGKNRLTMTRIPPVNVSDYACEDADIALRLYHVLVPKLKENKLDSINNDIEIPLIRVLADLEEAGVSIDPVYFEKLSKKYEKKIIKQKKKIYEYAGYEFNVNSTKALQQLLFDELKLPKKKKTKTGYSTDQGILEDLRHIHPVADSLLEHRKYVKLKSTYVDALPLLINPETGKIHTSLNQTIVATGRLSSMEPNLQNIPIREKTGRAIRRGFIPSPGNVLLSLDYSQIELRIMAHYSEDQGLMETFINSDVDVHTRTAASLFAVPEKEVNPDMRARAKVVNFSIIYGVTEFGLSRNLTISRESARNYIDKFFERYPGVRTYMDETIAFAEENGYVKTLSGRIRWIPDIKSSNRFRKEGAERAAINSPIQGTSADIIKIAMIKIHRDLQKAGLRSNMILQVHDELLFDVFPDEKEEVLSVTKEHMEKALKLKVPLKVDYKFGNNWDEAH